MSQSLKHNSSNNQLEVKGSEVFVGGLPRTITEDKINEIFSTCGEILEIRLIKDEKGSLKGFCFVRFSTKAAADKAVKEKSGLLLDGKKIGVLPSVDQDTLFLGNLYKGWNADEFDILVRQVFPEVVSVDLAMPSSSGETPPGQKKQNRGFAFVKFSSHAAAARALRASSSPAFLLGGKLHPAVDWAQEERQVDPEELAKIKIAFVRNLPAGADETFLKQLFVPLGKVEKVVLSKNARYLVGFVHFANRSELDDAIKEMNGKTVQGPNGGPSVKLQVEVARPMDKSKKRVREEPQTKQSSTITSQSKHGRIDHTTFNAFGVLKATAQQEPVATDPYEAAVVLLPVAIKERLLRILRLGIATRFDIDIECLTSLRELPESTAISVLDQFMLSGAEKHNKGAFLTGLISRHQVDKLGLYGFPPSSLSRLGDIPRKESGLSGFSSRGAHLPAFDPISSHVGLTTVRSDGPMSRYPSVYSDYPLSSRASFGRIQDASPGQASFGRIQDASPLSHLHQTPGPSTPYGKVGLDSYLTAAAADRQTSRPQVVLDSHLTGAVDRQILRPSVGLDSHLTGAVDRQILGPSVGLDSHLTGVADRQSSRSQVRFDPFTGQPYKFDPFTGEPIRPESPPRLFRSPY